MAIGNTRNSANRDWAARQLRSGGKALPTGRLVPATSGAAHDPAMSIHDPRPSARGRWRPTGVLTTRSWRLAGHSRISSEERRTCAIKQRVSTRCRSPRLAGAVRRRVVSVGGGSYNCRVILTLGGPAHRSTSRRWPILKIADREAHGRVGDCLRLVAEGLRAGGLSARGARRESRASVADALGPRYSSRRSRYGAYGASGWTAARTAASAKSNPRVGQRWGSST
jgi:hypothetical protein